jgi:protein ImuA
LRNRVDLEGLRARIRAIELGFGESAAAGEAPEAVPLGANEIDRALPWGGLLCGALHEVVAAPFVTGTSTGSAGAARTVPDPVTAATGAATGFAAALAGRLAGAGARGLVLWCLGRGDLYAPGLPALGLDPARLVVVRARRTEEALWVAEEALRSGRLAAVVCEGADAGLVASRRLQLAARAHGTACLLLCRDGAGAGAAAAVTRWRITAAPSVPSPGGAPGAPRWRVELARCRGGPAPRRWTVGWDHETGGFAVAAPLADRPRLPSRLAG